MISILKKLLNYTLELNVSPVINQFRLKKLVIALVSIAILLLLSFVMVLHLHSFLSPNKPLTNAKILVVDSWLHDAELDEAIKEFHRGSYDYVIVPGTKIDRSLFYAGIDNSGDLSALVLIYKGIPTARLVPLHVQKVRKDRTFQSALTVLEWLQKKGRGKAEVNLFTQSCHARRSWLLYRKAFQSNRQVGIISAQTLEYDPKKWWKTSNGFRTVIDETVAYLYAFLFFHTDM